MSEMLRQSCAKIIVTSSLHATMAQPLPRRSRRCFEILKSAARSASGIASELSTHTRRSECSPRIRKSSPRGESNETSCICKCVALFAPPGWNKVVLIRLFQFLIAGREVDYRQPTVAKPDPRLDMIAIAVRSAMTEDIGRSAKQGSIDLGPPAIVENTRYATHLL